jgi:hypothetical protein
VRLWVLSPVLQKKKKQWKKMINCHTGC